jgi:signal transduction histidine kinase
MPPKVRTVLAWCGACVFPIVLFSAVAIGPQPTMLLGWGYVLPILIMFLPASLLRRRPLVALGLMFLALFAMMLFFRPGAAGAYAANTWYIQAVAIDIAVGFIAANHRRRISLIAAASTLVAQLACAFYYTVGGPAFSSVAAFMALALFVVWLMGRSIRQRREWGDAQRAQASVQAVQAERLRIARELHDMIAHSIGVIAIQAGVGSRVIETQPAEARKALDVIEDTSRETLAGLRRMLGALRRAESGPEPEAAPLDPSPGLADLDGLTRRSLDAGVRVDLRRCGLERTLPADIDLSAYRIVQEAVTNVVRHSGTHECRVSLDYGDDALFVEVTDDGRGGLPGAGYGIPGMRERVSLLHGDFAAGPRPEGGFRVAAKIPVPVEVR